MKKGYLGRLSGVFGSAIVASCVVPASVFAESLFTVKNVQKLPGGEYMLGFLVFLILLCIGLGLGIFLQKAKAGKVVAGLGTLAAFAIPIYFASQPEQAIESTNKISKNIVGEELTKDVNIDTGSVGRR